MATAIAVTSGKGGTGKTSLVGAVGSCLAALGHPTLCIDMDVGLRNLDLTLGLSDRALMDFTDVAQGRCPLQRAVVEHPDIKGLFLLTAPYTLPGSLTEEAVGELLRQARELYDYILLDAPAGLGEGFQLAVCGCDRAIVVSTTDASALRDAQRTVGELTQRQVEQVHLVVNRVQPKLLRKLHTTIDDAMDTAGLPLLGVVPEDSLVTLCANQGAPLILRTNKGAAVGYRNIALRLDGRKIPVMRIR
ncbi:MAG: septum site-determining protein MinD [Oscillospiraceae bacterium]|nr:septum site-determining protein MinD [Oscillospiraceae bacterium]